MAARRLCHRRVHRCVCMCVCVCVSLSVFVLCKRMPVPVPLPLPLPVPVCVCVPSRFSHRPPPPHVFDCIGVGMTVVWSLSVSSMTKVQERIDPQAGETLS